MSAIDDGSDKPSGYVTEDGELEVREQSDGTRSYVETELGQHQRWLRQAPDLYEKYQELLAKKAAAPVGASLRDALQLDQPWPVTEVLLRLADVADHLLSRHNCDALGWEGVGYARDQARQIAAKLREALASSPTPPPRCTCIGAGVDCDWTPESSACPVHGKDRPHADTAD